MVLEKRWLPSPINTETVGNDLEGEGAILKLILRVLLTCVTLLQRGLERSKETSIDGLLHTACSRWGSSPGELGVHSSVLALSAVLCSLPRGNLICGKRAG